MADDKTPALPDGTDTIIEGAERKTPGGGTAVAEDTTLVAEREIPAFARVGLTPGQTFEGPAVVTQSDCTTCIPRGYSARVDAYRNLILTRGDAGKSKE